MSAESNKRRNRRQALSKRRMGKHRPLIRLRLRTKIRRVRKLIAMSATKARIADRKRVKDKCARLRKKGIFLLNPDGEVLITVEEPKREDFKYVETLIDRGIISARRKDGG